MPSPSTKFSFLRNLVIDSNILKVAFPEDTMTILKTLTYHDGLQSHMFSLKAKVYLILVSLSNSTEY